MPDERPTLIEGLAPAEQEARSESRRWALWDLQRGRRDALPGWLTDELAGRREELCESH